MKKKKKTTLQTIGSFVWLAGVCISWRQTGWQTTFTSDLHTLGLAYTSRWGVPCTTMIPSLTIIVAYSLLLHTLLYNNPVFYPRRLVRASLRWTTDISVFHEIWHWYNIYRNALLLTSYRSIFTYIISSYSNVREYTQGKLRFSPSWYVQYVD